MQAGSNNVFFHSYFHEFAKPSDGLISLTEGAF